MPLGRYVLSALLAVLLSLPALLHASPVDAGVAADAASGLGSSPSRPIAALDTVTGEVVQVDAIRLETRTLPAYHPGFVTVQEIGQVQRSGLGSSPSAPATPGWVMQVATFLVFGLGALRAAKPKLFETDGAGAALGFGAAMLYTLAEAAQRGEYPSWALAKDGFVVTATMWGGYAVLYKKIAKPLALKLAVKFQWTWLAELLAPKAK